MPRPLVSFVVPCYKLAHLLPKCIDSILTQSFDEFEVLVMDDCSPDGTRAVVEKFQDQRIKYVRNEDNLGHLRNYNKGIQLSQGKYIWLISADDYLRRPYIVQRYVDALEANPRIAYAFCPAISVKNDEEIGVLDYSVFRDHDCVVEGATVLYDLLSKNIVPAASGMVRRSLYEQVGLFPLNMPYVGDWYLWSVFALHGDVAFFSEPMVCYREHGASMTSTLADERAALDSLSRDIEMFWRLKDEAESAGYNGSFHRLLDNVAIRYGRLLATANPGTRSSAITRQGFEAALAAAPVDRGELVCVRTKAFEAAGDALYWEGDMYSAKAFYSSCLRDHWISRVFVKRLLLSLGGVGQYLRQLFAKRQLERKQLLNDRKP